MANFRTAVLMKGDARGQLLVGIKSVTVPFDDVYDIANGTLKIRPLVDLPDDLDTDDYMFFRNSGAEYEPD